MKLKIKIVIRKVDKSIVAFLRVVVLLLFMSYYANSSLFLHTHYFECGAVTHSHPYSQATSHSHSYADCHLLSIYTNPIFAIASLIFSLWCGVAYFNTQRRKTGLKSSFCSKRAPLLRAPPVCLSL